jgi:uncharacterized protein (DUF58 family)
MDFLRLGTPMQLVLWILSVIFVSNASKWYLSWIITAFVLFVVSIAMIFNVSPRRLLHRCKRARSQNEDKTY